MFLVSVLSQLRAALRPVSWAALLVAGTICPAGADPAVSAAAQRPAPLSFAVTRQAGVEGRVLWMDATANLQRLSSREAVGAIFDKCRQAGINTVVVDVKPLSGHVLYASSLAPRLTEWRGLQYPPDYDLLQTAVFEGRRRGLKVYAGVNIFCEAHKLVRSGPLYERPEHQATVYDVRRTVRTTAGTSHLLAVGENHGPGAEEIASYDASAPDGKRIGTDDAAAVVERGEVTALVDGSLSDGGVVAAPEGGHLLVGRGAGARWLLEHLEVGTRLEYSAASVLLPILEAPSEVVGGFVNPAHPEARARAKRIVEEIANNYPVDGIVLDRARFSSLKTDFSPLSRQLFEEWLGKRLERFPEDVYEYAATPGEPVKPGPYFREWLEWRARLIHDWVQEVRESTQRLRPGLQLAAYVGSWYDRYYGVGVNWGAPGYRPMLPWMSAGYPATGYAPLLSWLTTGCYYGVSTREDARRQGHPEERTVEAAAETSIRATDDATFVYAGLFALDYKDRPEEFRKALQVAVEGSHGVMVFDLHYLEEYDWWNILSESFSVPRRAPHDVPGLLPALRRVRAVLEAAGVTRR